VFDAIEDPATFPPIHDTLSAELLEISRRYIDAAEELAESELLCGSDSITISWDQNERERRVEFHLEGDHARFLCPAATVRLE
jgi:hypothetical protein